MGAKEDMVKGKKILIVDDEPDILNLVSLHLKKGGFRTKEFLDVDSLYRFLKSEIPDLIILDLMLPDTDGYEVCKHLKKEDAFSNIPIIMLTARAEESERILGLELGADDYIAKPFSMKVLLARVKAVLRRRAPEMTEDPVEVGGLKLDPISHRVFGGDVPLDLGPTEFRLLHFFMTHPERVYSRAQLLDQVWGRNVYIEERTVDVHIRRLRLALEPHGADRLIETVRGSGYRLAMPK